MHGFSQRWINHFLHIRIQCQKLQFKKKILYSLGNKTGSFEVMKLEYLLNTLNLNLDEMTIFLLNNINRKIPSPDSWKLYGRVIFNINSSIFKTFLWKTHVIQYQSSGSYLFLIVNQVNEPDKVNDNFHNWNMKNFHEKLAEFHQM